MKIVNLCGNKYRKCGGDWGKMYFYVMEAFHKMGYKVHVSPHLIFDGPLPEYAFLGIEDSNDHVYVYNHTYTEELVKDGWYLGSKTLIIKPTGPTPECFTLDLEGFASASSITYNKPNFLSTEVGDFFDTTVKSIIKNKKHKWSNRTDIVLDAEIETNLPEDYTLVLGQMPGDSTVTEMSFGDHWRKLRLITLNLLQTSKYPVVLKVHPSLIQEAKGSDLDYYIKDMEVLEAEGAIVLKEAVNIHDVLPKARVVIVENSTSGIEALLHQKPLISYGYPEYHWVTKDLRHLHKLTEFVKNLNWHNKQEANKWVCWYYNSYLCKNAEETYNALKGHIDHEKNKS
jgi:hypothetical protein